MTQAEKNIKYNQKGINDAFKQDMRKRSVDLALNVPDNRQSYSNYNPLSGTFQNVPKQKSVDDILKDAEKIYKYLIQTK